MCPTTNRLRHDGSAQRLGRQHLRHGSGAERCGDQLKFQNDDDRASQFGPLAAILLPRFNLLLDRPRARVGPTAHKVQAGWVSLHPSCDVAEGEMGGWCARPSSDALTIHPSHRLNDHIDHVHNLVIANLQVNSLVQLRPTLGLCPRQARANITKRINHCPDLHIANTAGNSVAFRFAFALARSACASLIAPPTIAAWSFPSRAAPPLSDPRSRGRTGRPVRKAQAESGASGSSRNLGRVMGPGPDR